MVEKQHFPGVPADKQQAFDTALELLKQGGFEKPKITDIQRPWGFFMYVAEAEASKFIEAFYQSVNIEGIDLNLPLQPKILGIAPGKRLSWQYHHRRGEVWRNTGGEFSVVLSETDQETEPKIVRLHDVIVIPQGTRHRGIGGDGWSLVAEIWQHTDPANPSNEDDIVRLQDDFGR